jgi:pectate lyase
MRTFRSGWLVLPLASLAFPSILGLPGCSAEPSTPPAHNTGGSGPGIVGGSAGAGPIGGGSGTSPGGAGRPNAGNGGSSTAGNAGSATAGSGGGATAGNAGSATAGSSGSSAAGSSGSSAAGNAGSSPGVGGASGSGSEPDAGVEPDGGVVDPETDEVIGFGRNATGGAGGPEVVVTSAAELIAAAASPEPLIITVQGTIVHDVSGGDDGARIWVASNKTIQGANAQALVDANFNIREATNIIFRNLNLQNPEGKGTGDAVEFTESCSDIWIDHVTFLQSADGSLDFKRGSDNITVSWCKFAYTSATHDHNYANLIGHTDTWTEDRGKLRVTMHHNWYAENVIERMPRVRYGQVHVFNNYYSSARTNYVIGVGVEAQILLEASYFENQGNQTWFNWFEPNKCDTPCADGKIQWTDDNVFDNTNVSTWAPNSDVFDPPYPYRHVLQSAAEAKRYVMERAGVRDQ